MAARHTQHVEQQPERRAEPQRQRQLPELGELDALVVDPPRAGLADGVVASIAAASPRRVAYVSCDASTWARDVARFEQEGYRLIRVTPVDLFPQTYHVEVVSIFERSGS